MTTPPRRETPDASGGSGRRRAPNPALDVRRDAVVLGEDGRMRWAEAHEPVPTAVATDEAACERRGSGEPTGLLVHGEAAPALRGLLDGTIPAPEPGPGDAPPGERRAGIRGRVQAVYIDPPYNTGGDFLDYADKVDHELWLAMMRERLGLLRETLATEGSLWLHIDDSEMAYAKVLLDEVFGRENCVSALVVENNPKGRQLGRFFAGSHDHLLVYARDIRRVRLDPGSAQAVNPADFPKSDERGPYRLLPLRNTNKRFHPGSVPTLHYGLWADAGSGRVAADPFDGATEVTPVFGDGTAAVWRWSAARVRERSDELVARIVRGRTGDRLDVYQVDRLHSERKKKLRSIWPAAEVGSSDSAKAELKKVLPGRQIFATPKPEPLLRRVLEAATGPGDLVLDCFAGSGTTPVVAQRSGRRWIAVELSGASIDAFVLPRLDREIADGGAYVVWRPGTTASPGVPGSAETPEAAVSTPNSSNHAAESAGSTPSTTGVEDRSGAAPST